MADFVFDACGGSGTFSGRSPTIGSVWHGFAYDIPYGNVTSPVDLRLPYLKLDGNGAAKYDSNLSGYYDISLTSAVPTSADYAVEISLMISGPGQTNSNISGSLCGRIRPNGEVKSLTWYIGYQDATHFFVELTYDNWTSDPDAPVGGVPARTYTNVSYGTLVTIRAEYVGREIRSFVNGDLKATLTNGGPYLDAIGKVAWAYRTYGSEFDPAHKIESLRATYNLSIGDLLRAEFNGTGDLTAYVPETGTLTFPIHTMSETGDVSYINNPTADRFIRNGAGAFQLDMNTGGVFNTLDPVIILMSGNKPTSLNYAVEASVSIPSHATAPNLNLYCTVGGRATLDSSNQGWWNYAGLQFNMSQGTGGIFISVRPMLYGANCDASFDEVGSWISLPSLGFNAQTIKVRVEFKGRSIWGYVNDNPVAAYGTITEWKWTPNNGTSSIYDAPGDAGFDAYLQNEANESVGLSATKVERLLVTYDLLPKAPPPPGAFWTEYQACAEVLP